MTCSRPISAKILQDKMDEKKLRTKLRRIVGGYRGGMGFVKMFETDFKCIFSKTQVELELSEYDLQKIIEMSNPEQLERMIRELDIYKLDY